jgi:hypothetical protein
MSLIIIIIIVRAEILTVWLWKQLFSVMWHRVVWQTFPYFWDNILPTSSENGGNQHVYQTTLCHNFRHHHYHQDLTRLSFLMLSRCPALSRQVPSDPAKLRNSLSPSTVPHSLQAKWYDNTESGNGGAGADVHCWATDRKSHSCYNESQRTSRCQVASC